MLPHDDDEPPGGFQRLFGCVVTFDDHTGNMAAFGALAAPAQTPSYSNVIPLRG